MKFLVTPPFYANPENAEALALLQKFATEIVYDGQSGPLSEERLCALLPDVDGYIAGVDYITDRAMACAPRLKVISRYGVGVDRVDLAAAKKRGITVCNTPGANSVAVAEMALCMMICAARNIPAVHSGVLRGEWPLYTGMELYKKTLGIIGFGSIGKLLATRAKAMGMRVLANDLYFDKDFAAQNGVEFAELPALLQEANYISVHCPSTPETHHLINAANIAAMQDKAIIINTARGGIVDEAAAAAALKQGKLGGIALDAFETEPITDSPLLGLDNVIISPHNGSNTLEACANMGLMSTQNAIAVLKGEPCKFIVNR